jgi:hypothetical protein
MERISALRGASRADLKTFNQCCLYLGVFFVSEISSANGLTLDRTAWNGSQARFSPFLWPFQPKPGPGSWRVWRRLLAQEFLFDAPKRTTQSNKDLSLLIINHFLFYVAPGNPIKEVPWRPRAATPSGRRGQQ